MTRQNGFPIGLEKDIFWNKKDVLAFFSRRGEEEIVIEAGKVENKKEI